METEISYNIFPVYREDCPEKSINLNGKWNEEVEEFKGRIITT